MKGNLEQVTCDVLVIGTGAGGMASAITARKHGLDVLVVEKEAVFGGSTAVSGGGMWVPCNGLAQRAGIRDSVEAARRYIRDQAGEHFDGRRVDAFLKHGPEMVSFFERETAVAFDLALVPDYYAEKPGAAQAGRPLGPKSFDARELGEHAKLLAPPIRGMTFVGLMFGSGADMRHFMNALRSFTSAVYTLKRLVRYMGDLITHGRNMRLFNGAALAARLYKTAMDAGIRIWLGSPAIRLLSEGGRVVGAVVEREGTKVQVFAARGVVLATGGFPHDLERRKAVYPHAPSASEHISLAPEANTGDGLRMAEAIGARTNMLYPNLGSWVPASRVPLGDGAVTKVFHIMDRGKPGIIAVGADGRRFANEGANYHEFGAAMIRGTRQPMFIVGDHTAVRKYGLGFAKPFPVPLWPYLRSGYLLRGRTIEELAARAGIDPSNLRRTIETFNEHARKGVDPDFHKGEAAYDRFQGDATHQPNPCVGPLDTGPFYAVRMVPGDIGTFGGLQTDEFARVLGTGEMPIPGLYAVGNDMASIFGGSYPGGGATLGPAMTFGYIIGRHLADAGATAQPPGPEILASFENAWNTAASTWRVDDLAGLYAEDAVLFAGRPGLAAGRAQIRDYFASYASDLKSAGLALFEQHVADLPSGVILAQGFGKLRLENHSGRESTTVIRTTWAIVHRNGDWKIAQHHFSLTPDAPPMPS